MAAATTLSTNDARVLSALFDPESSASTNTITITPQPSTTTESSLKAAEAAAIQPLNTATPSPSAIQTALEALTTILTSHPNHASAYANRAQALRLKMGDDALFDEGNEEDASLLFADLSRCIALSTPSSSTSSSTSASAQTQKIPPQVTPSQAALLATTHTHRGYLLVKASLAAALQDSSTGRLQHGPRELVGKSKEELEEWASAEFALGGRYGDRKARQAAVRTNPYAKMCGAIVREAMEKEMEEWNGGL